MINEIPDTLPVIGTVLHTRSTKKGIDIKRTPLKYLCTVDAKAHRKWRRQYHQELEKAAWKIAAEARLAQLRGAVA